MSVSRTIRSAAAGIMPAALVAIIFASAACAVGQTPATETRQAPPDAYGIDPARQETDTPSTATATTEPETRFQRAPRARQAPPGKVWPTAAGDLGGATSYTQSMPTDVEGLIALRRPFIKRPEFRAAWVTRFDWTGRGGSVDAGTLKKRIVDIMTSAQNVGLNAIIFQVRGDATTLYPSKLEPWSQRLGGKDPGFDPLKFAIDEAHERGLEFHAYINPVPCSEEKTSAPASKDHLWHKHCLPNSVPNWLVFKNGEPAPFNEYKWMNPNLPDVQTYIRTVVLDLVKRYDVDGVHYDRIRFPSPDVSDDPWSKARFGSGANPNGKHYGEWQAENITRMLTDIYGSIMEIKPQIKVSASVWGIYDNTVLPQGKDKATGYSWTSSGLQDYRQDSIGWLNHGCMDALVPMIYWSMGDLKPDYDELLLAFTSSVKNGRHIYGGMSGFANEEMLREVVATNLIGAHGTVPFTLGRITRGDTNDFYKQHIYPEPAPRPDMIWKSNPTFGHALTTVTDSNGKPVTDAHVKVSGNSYAGLSSADGFCAIINVLPGEVEITAEKPGVGKASGKATIARGKAARIELKLAQ